MVKPREKLSKSSTFCWKLLEKEAPLGSIKAFRQAAKVDVEAKIVGQVVINSTYRKASFEGKKTKMNCKMVAQQHPS